MDKPTPKVLRDATGISQPYASMILSGDRTPARSLAIRIFRETGWRHAIIADLNEEQMSMLELIEPWTPREEQAA